MIANGIGGRKKYLCSHQIIGRILLAFALTAVAAGVSVLAVRMLNAAIDRAILALIVVGSFLLFFGLRRILSRGQVKGNWTDLQTAARGGDANKVRELLRAGEDPDAKGVLGMTALMFAAGKVTSIS